jgi:hypothetical protein
MAAGEDINPGGNLNAIVCGAGRFVVGGQGGKIAYSNMQE